MITVNVKELSDFSLFLRSVAPELDKAFLSSLTEVGEVVKKKAQTNANAFPREHAKTDRIAQSLKVRRRGTRVTVVAGGTSAPEATPLEHGGHPGKIRHPVFGSTTTPWQEQDAHPFLVPAGLESQPEALAALVSCVDRAFHQSRFINKEF